MSLTGRAWKSLRWIQTNTMKTKLQKTEKKTEKRRIGKDEQNNFNRIAEDVCGFS